MHRRELKRSAGLGGVTFTHRSDAGKDYRTQAMDSYLNKSSASAGKKKKRKGRKKNLGSYDDVRTSFSDQMGSPEC